MMSEYHESVLLKEAVTFLDIQPGRWYIDATLGGGGHAREIIKQGGKVIGIDRDQEALDYVEENFKFLISNNQNDLRLVRGNFSEIESIVHDLGIAEIWGVLFDFGVSSHQLNTAERGFSFQDGPLDMRMDQRLGVDAKDLLHGLTKDELVQLFERFGEERNAWKIAGRIVEERVKRKIQTTNDLVRIITSSVRPKPGGIHPATRVFQALRIAVNDELNSIEKALPQAVNTIVSSGRIVTIAFHSLEDRIVKNSFLNFEEKQLGTILTKKPVVPTADEIANNPRSRSAKLRVFEKK